MEDPVADALAPHLDALRQFVRRRLGRRVAAMESVSDILQSTCREVLAGAERLPLDDAQAFRAWLFTTALRKIVSKDRYYSAAKRDVDRLAGDAPRAAEANGSDTPSARMIGQEQLAAFETAFASLDETHREVITLARFMGLPHEEIGGHLGISAAASRQLLRRALLRLSLALGSNGDG